MKFKSFGLKNSFYKKQHIKIRQLDDVYFTAHDYGDLWNSTVLGFASAPRHVLQTFALGSGQITRVKRKILAGFYPNFSVIKIKR